MKSLLRWIMVLLSGIVGLPAQDAALKTIVTSNGVPASVHELKGHGIENFYQLGEQIYSGSAPEGAAAFAQLQSLGIKTIITVDGTKPDVETAHRFGMHYVHLPIGYDGVPVAQGLRLVKAAETVPGPIFVHCHHGQHRGPAGAAVICMAMDGWTPDQAESWLRLAGTSTNYAGLYRSVEQFRPPSAEVLKTVSGEFQEKSPVSPLADVMIQIDQRFDLIKIIKKTGYQQPVNHPDLEPVEETLLLDELFKELQRSPIIDKRTDDFMAKLSKIEGAVKDLHISVSTSPANVKLANDAFQRITEDCAACHKRYRN